ncbi:hypothetical protein J6590_078560 [Homalodisca vitripennis]|nr:hypothetical protein J6590_078560 [Homalodisca vitripennis]
MRQPAKLPLTILLWHPSHLNYNKLSLPSPLFRFTTPDAFVREMLKENISHEDPPYTIVQLKENITMCIRILEQPLSIKMMPPIHKNDAKPTRTVRVMPQTERGLSQDNRSSKPSVAAAWKVTAERSCPCSGPPGWGGWVLYTLSLIVDSRLPEDSAKPFTLHVARLTPYLVTGRNITPAIDIDYAMIKALRNCN